MAEETASVEATPDGTRIVHDLTISLPVLEPIFVACGGGWPFPQAGTEDTLRSLFDALLPAMHGVGEVLAPGVPRVLESDVEDRSLKDPALRTWPRGLGRSQQWRAGSRQALDSLWICQIDAHYTWDNPRDGDFWKAYFSISHYGKGHHLSLEDRFGRPGCLFSLRFTAGLAAKRPAILDSLGTVFGSPPVVLEQRIEQRPPWPVKPAGPDDRNPA